MPSPPRSELTRPPHVDARPPARGDEAGLFAAHHDALVRQLERSLRIPREEAEDACAFAWVQLLRYQPERTTIVGWLYTVARNELFHARRRRRDLASESTLETIAHDVGDPLDVLEARELIQLMPRLKPQQRLVVWLRIEGYSYREMCALTGKTYTWVNRHLSEGRVALRKLASGIAS